MNSRHRAQPVSYTHLDVYKRQVSFRAPKRRLIVGAGILVLLVVGTVGFLLIRSVHTGAAQTIWGQNNTERLAFEMCIRDRDYAIILKIVR